MIINNGTVMLGINPAGNLNVDSEIPSSGEGDTALGLRYMPTGAEATAGGCPCEGWGVADATSLVSGGANEDSGGSFGLTVDSFVNDSASATSTVTVGTTFRVVHAYHPSVTPNLYQVDVYITNISASPVHLLYRRVMDWDIEPTAFDEFSTVNVGSATNLVFTSNDGFASADPLSGPSDIGFTGSFTDAGPDDHGALFDFDFGTVDPGAVFHFRTFYGAAGTEAEADDAITRVGAEAFSYGQPNTEGGPDLGTPNTFIFAFAGIGGQALFQPDLQIKKGSDPDSAFAIDNVYQPVPEGDQIEQIDTSAGATATCQVKVENDGNTAKTLTVRAVETNATGWTVSYSVGPTDVTSQIRGEGGYITGELAPGASEIINVNMSPGASASADLSAVLQVFLDSEDLVVHDAVQALGVLPVQFTLDFPAGLSLFAVPFDVSGVNPATLFGVPPSQLNLAYFDGVLIRSGDYVYFDGSNFNLLRGNGYWGKFDQPKSLVIKSTSSPNTSERFLLPAGQGWFQIGNPWLGSLPWNLDEILILQNGRQVGTLAGELRKPFESRYCEMYCYIWDQEAGAYKLVFDPSYLDRLVPSAREGTVDHLGVGAGAFMYFNQPDLTLSVPSILGASAASAPRASRTKGRAKGWTAEMRAQCGEAVSAGNLFGQSDGLPGGSEGFQAFKPPVMLRDPQWVDVSFAPESSRTRDTAGGSLWGMDLRPRSSSTRWRAVVTSNAPGQDVTLSWPNLSQVPSPLRLTLVDEATGKRLAMRTATAYQFRADSRERTFRLELSDANATRLRINNLTTG
ncbi:MAG: hypothetical protein HY318_16335, partial [Armatimonadetes bacterium]|nr:hypothetical protein [Armatimonadota bacterium]